MARKPSSKNRRPERSVKPQGPLILRNPHAVFAVLESRPQDVIEICIDIDRAAPAWKRVVEKANDIGRPIRPAIQEPSKPGKRPDSDQRATLATARVLPKPEVSLRELFHDVDETGGIWLVLEHIQDPHNLGAITRTAAFFGVRGLILTKDQSAALTPIAYDISAGGVEAIPHCTVTNVSRTIDTAREAGLWVLGTSEHADDALANIAGDRPWLVIVGNEESGLRRLTKEKCDSLVSIPCRGKVTSLNVSVATGIVLGQVAKSQ